MLVKTHYKQNLGSDLKVSPTAGIIWDLKYPPGWDEVSYYFVYMRVCQRETSYSRHNNIAATKKQLTFMNT